MFLPNSMNKITPRNTTNIHLNIDRVEFTGVKMVFYIKVVRISTIYVYIKMNVCVKHYKSETIRPIKLKI